MVYKAEIPPKSIGWLEKEDPIARMQRKHREQAKIEPGLICRHLAKRYLVTDKGNICAPYQVSANWTNVGVGCQELINDHWCPLICFDYHTPPTSEDLKTIERYFKRWMEYHQRPYTPLPESENL